MAFVPLNGALLRPSRHSLRNACPTRMALGKHVGHDTTADEYVALGIAKCFTRSKAKLAEVLVLEPLPSSALHCVIQLGVPTSYTRLWATKLGDLPDDVTELPPGVIKDGEVVSFGENFSERAQASARTYRKWKEIADLLPIGTISTELNHSIANKRILNDTWEPNFNDNVKQDKSIDVYNRDDSAGDSGSIQALYNA